MIWIVGLAIAIALFGFKDAVGTLFKILFWIGILTVGAYAAVFGLIAIASGMS